MNRPLPIQFFPLLEKVALKRGAIFGGILIAALLAFEVFNFGTTSFALQDMLGELTFAGMRWSTVLAFAFCGIDFAGIARMFTPEQGSNEPAEIWYLFWAWLLAAGFNASLTWWGVAVAMLDHNARGSVLVGQSAMTNIVPVLVAGMVWLIRVLIIGTFAVAGERLFALAETRPQSGYYQRNQNVRPPVNQPIAAALPRRSDPRPAPKPQPNPPPTYVPRPEPTYHPIGMSASNRDNQHSATRR